MAEVADRLKSAGTFVKGFETDLLEPLKTVQIAKKRRVVLMPS
jgi:hypothetical protein